MSFDLLGLTIAQYGLGTACGAVIGFMLALVGGGGSILATPLLLFVVGLHDAHSAIGTAAFAVTVNALSGLWRHGRDGLVNWRCGGAYAAIGVIGTGAGAILGRALDSNILLIFYAGLMACVSFLLMRTNRAVGIEGATCNRANARQLAGCAMGTGLLSGLFGIGGGFLIVPGLVLSARLPIARAMATSLLVVAAFGLTTTIAYASAGYVLWILGLFMMAGGLAGVPAGAWLSRRMGTHQGLLNRLLAALILAAAAYLAARAIGATHVVR